MEQEFLEEKYGDIAKQLPEKIKNLITKNEDGTYTVKMPGDIEDYRVKDLTNREEQSCEKLATKEISVEDMKLIRFVVEPKIKTDEWLDLPSKIKNRLVHVKRYLDGDLDFLL